MDYLLRGDAPFYDEQWEKIDNTVIKIAKQVLIGRRFLNIHGPLGSGMQSINIDNLGINTEGCINFFGDDETIPVKTKGRKFIEIPMVYKDFTISWRDVENSKQFKLPLDLSTVSGAAAICSKKEDELIFNGSKQLGYEGLLNAEGAERIEKSNWYEGENPFRDVAKGLEVLVNKGFVGNFVLTVSPDLYMQMQRIQPHTGVLEVDRVKKLVEGNLYQSSVLGNNKAVLVCSQAQNMDLVIGQDMITAYLGSENLNHSLRVFETILLRVKRKDSIVIFE